MRARQGVNGAIDSICKEVAVKEFILYAGKFRYPGELKESTPAEGRNGVLHSTRGTRNAAGPLSPGGAALKVYPAVFMLRIMLH
jgi:hypothetical protein